MKNYELIAKLEKLPAGAEISFGSICSQREIDLDLDTDGNEIYHVFKKICDVEYDEKKETVMLS